MSATPETLYEQTLVLRSQLGDEAAFEELRAQRRAAYVAQVVDRRLLEFHVGRQAPPCECRRSCTLIGGSVAGRLSRRLFVRFEGH